MLVSVTVMCHCVWQAELDPNEGRMRTQLNPKQLEAHTQVQKHEIQKHSFLRLSWRQLLYTIATQGQKL